MKEVFMVVMSTEIDNTRNSMNGDHTFLRKKFKYNTVSVG